MSQSDSPATAAFAGAQVPIRAALAGTIAEVAHNLLMRMKTAATYHHRGQLAVAQRYVLENQEHFLATFATLLAQSIDDDLAGGSAPRAASDDTDWQSISLVDDDQIESTIAFKRIGQLIGHASEAELRELDGYASTLLGHASADPTRNPLRGDVIGTAIQRALEKSVDDVATQKILAHEFGPAMARAMPGCYRQIIDSFKARGVHPVDLALRQVDDSGRAPPAATDPLLDEARRAWERSWNGRMSQLPPDTLRSWESSIVGRFGNIDPLPAGFDDDNTAALLERLMRGALPGDEPSPGDARQGDDAAELMGLLRRLNVAAHARGDFERTTPDSGPGALSRSRSAPLGQRDVRRSSFGGLSGLSGFGSFEQPPATGLSGLMAVNLIRAHRDELDRMARSQLDHLVIEVVSSLFDQVLSDAKVPPQMARQIARLQLPVLRVTLSDPRFFSSRRHPVRRFVNRIASLASAFEDLESGPGKELLERVGALITEIVEGDFDQPALYDAKLAELERFTAEQTHAQIRASDAAATLRAKEIEWRIERVFGQRLRSALEPLALPHFVLDFLAGAWAQAIVAATREGGSTGALAVERRRIGVQLVRSLQAKRSIEERQEFVQALPTVMSGLLAGMEAIQWPKPARQAFFDALVALHMESLKAAPRSELDRNMTVRQLEVAFKTRVPRVGDELDHADEAIVATSVGELAEQHFTSEEESAIGLVAEDAVDWAVPVEGSAAAASAPTTAKGSSDAAAPARPVADVSEGPPSTAAPTAADGSARPPASTQAPALRAVPAESANAAIFPSGSELREQLQLGFAYLLNLKGAWQKVRLSYMSPARNLFLFSHGAKDRETISMTARTLDRLCDAGRMRALETAYLVERSTERARRQLAELNDMKNSAAA